MVLLLVGNIVTDVLLLLAPMPMSSRLIGAITLGLALLWATATFLVLGGLTRIAPVDEVVKQLLLGNAVTGVLLLAIIGREVWIVVQARWRERAGSRLHIQIVSLFAVIAAVPTILVAVVASTTLDRGLDRFFSTRTRAMIEQSLTVANAYVSEHAADVRGEDMAMAFDLSRAKPIFDQDRNQFRKFLAAQTSGRNLSVALMIKSDGSIVEPDGITLDKRFLRPSPQLLAETSETEPQIAFIAEGDNVASVVKLTRLRRHVSLRRAAARSACRATIAQYPGERRRIRQSRGTAARHPDRVRVDVRGDCADRSVVRGMDRPGFRQPAGRADPPPDRRRQRGLDRQSPHSSAGAPLRRRSRAIGRDLQQDDAGAAHAA